MKELSQENYNSVYVKASNPQDFNDIFFAASHKDVTIERVQENEILENLEHAQAINSGDMVLKITFGDNNGTRQSFMESLCGRQDDTK